MPFQASSIVAPSKDLGSIHAAVVSLQQLLKEHGLDGATAKALKESGGTLSDTIKGPTAIFDGGNFGVIDLTQPSPKSGQVAYREYKRLYGWINFKDVAGTITVNGKGGNIDLSVTFRTGTAAGDYTLTSGTAFADAFWCMTGCARNTANVTIVMLNNPAALHSTTQLNFVCINPAGTLIRPDGECLLIVEGN